MFRLKKSSSGEAKNHEVLYDVAVHICEPSGIQNAHSHILQNFMVLSLAWRCLFKSKHVALIYAFII